MSHSFTETRLTVGSRSIVEIYLYPCMYINPGENVSLYTSYKPYMPVDNNIIKLPKSWLYKQKILNK